MKPEEAISVLDQVTAQIPLVRADQAKVLQALQTLRDATTSKPGDDAEKVEYWRDKYEDAHRQAANDLQAEPARE